MYTSKLIEMHLITSFRAMDPHQRCLLAKVKTWNGPKQAMPKSHDLSRLLEINLFGYLIRNSQLFSINMHIYYFQVCI